MPLSYELENPSFEHRRLDASRTGPSTGVWDAFLLPVPSLSIRRSLMPRFRFLSLLAVAVLATAASAQTISSGFIGTFVDLSAAGTNGNAITPTDDSAHNITTTVGNGLFPAGPITISNNGHCYASMGTTSVYSNVDIVPGSTTVPTGLVGAANGILLPHWDDLYPNASHPTQIYWQEIGGVLYIEWFRENHFADATVNQDVTFEVQVFSAPPAGSPWIQYLYLDTVFGGTFAANDNGASATVGWVAGANTLGLNAKWSFDTAGAITSGMVLSIFPPMILNFSSPGGPGALQVDLTSGPPSGAYFLCVTLNAGAYPNGYFFGITPSFQEIVNEANGGWPFVFGLDASGSYTIGPFPPFSLPSGLGLYAVALGFDTGVLDYPSLRSAPKNYVIP
jgi:hypothetical protein